MNWSGNDRLQGSDFHQLPLVTEEGEEAVCEAVVMKADDGTWSAEFDIFIESEKDLVIAKNTRTGLPSIEDAKDCVRELVADVIRTLQGFIGDTDGIQS